MQHKMTIVNRVSAGRDDDLFIFKVDNKRIKRIYGDRYTDAQAKNLLLREIEQGKVQI